MEETYRFCTKCRSEKYIEYFGKDKKGKNGRSSQCRECRKGQTKAWQNKNPEKVRGYKKKWRDNNPSYFKEYYQDNKEYLDEQSRKRYEQDREHYLEYQKEYQQVNKEKRRCYLRTRYHTDVDFKLTQTIRQMVHRVLRTKSKEGSTFELLRYGPQEFRKRIEMQFEPGMTWDNHGEVWEIDHKIPIQQFLNKGEKRPEIINALSNLQPMWVKENRGKNQIRSVK